MESICRLCLQSKPLRKSHILPEFMYHRIYDEAPRSFSALVINIKDINKSTRRIEQKGKREYLFCNECESLLSKYEKYAAESIFGKNNISKHFIKQEIIQGFDKIIYHYNGFNYIKLKKFLLSILWRLSISKSFQTPFVEESINESLRKLIFYDVSLPFDSYGCVIHILTSNGKKVGRFINGPYETYNNYTSILNIIIDGIQFCFYLCENGKISDETPLFFLREDGNMIILNKDIKSDPVLIERLKRAFEYYRKNDT